MSSKLGRWLKGGGPGGARSRRGPTPQEALARLRETEEMLTKKQEYLESRIARELAAARQHGTRNKRGESRHPPTPGAGTHPVPPARPPAGTLPPRPGSALPSALCESRPGIPRGWGLLSTLRSCSL